MAHSFEELMAGAAAAHEREVRQLRQEVETLRGELSQAGPSAPEGGRKIAVQPQRRPDGSTLIGIPLPGSVAGEDGSAAGEELDRVAGEMGGFAGVVPSGPLFVRPKLTKSSSFSSFEKHDEGAGFGRVQSEKRSIRTRIFGGAPLGAAACGEGPKATPESPPGNVTSPRIANRCRTTPAGLALQLDSTGGSAGQVSSSGGTQPRAAAGHRRWSDSDAESDGTQESLCAAREQPALESLQFTGKRSSLQLPQFSKKGDRTTSHLTASLLDKGGLDRRMSQASVGTHSNASGISRASSMVSASRVSRASSMVSVSNRRGAHRGSIAASLQSVVQSFVEELERPVGAGRMQDQARGILEISPVWCELVEIHETPSLFRSSSICSTNFPMRKKSEPKEIISLPTPMRRRPSLRHFVHAPSSRQRLAWDMAGVIFLAYDLIMVPLQAFDHEVMSSIRLLNLLTTCFWTLDIFSSFLVGYHTKGLIVMEPRSIALRYLKSWFLLDLTIVLMDWAFHFSSANQATTLGKVSRGMRAVRLLRVAKLHALLSEVNILARIQTEFGRTMLGILKILIVILTLNHFIACGFYGLTFVVRADRNWVERNFEAEDGFGYRYWTSFHWSLTQFTPASMEVVPVNSVERFYTVCALLMALVTFSSFVSSITSAMTRLGSANLRQQQQTATLYRYLGQRGVSTELVNRVWHCLRTRRTASQAARFREEDVELFAVLPESLKVDLRYDMYLPIISGHPLLRSYSHMEPAAVRHICKSAIKEHALNVREELFGDCVDVSHMVFVINGTLTYTYPAREGTDDTHDTVEIGKGQWVCEAALWAASLELVGPFVAASSCDLLLLSVAEFVVVAKRFPSSVGLMTEYAGIFIDHAKEESKEVRWKSSLCNSPEALQDLAERAHNSHVTRAFNAMMTLEEESNKDRRPTVISNGSSASDDSAPKSCSSRKGGFFTNKWNAMRDARASPSGAPRTRVKRGKLESV